MKRMKRMKRISFQWRITLLTAILIAGTCICLNLLLYRWQSPQTVEAIFTADRKHQSGQSYQHTP